MMQTIDDFAVEGLSVLARADLNVPLDGGRVAAGTLAVARAMVEGSLGFIEDKTLPGLAVLEAS